MSSVVSIGSIGSPASTSSAGALEVDKAKCEAKLADWVHCVSATTPEGKEKIRDLSSELHRIDAQLKTAEREAPAAGAASGVDPAQRPAKPTDSLGNIVDVFV